MKNLTALLLFISMTGTAVAEPTLSGNQYLFSCPFYRLDNNFDTSGVMSAVKQIISDKIKIREECRAPLNQLQTSLSATDVLFQTMTKQKQDDILKGLYSRFRSEVQGKISILQGAGQAASAEGVALQTTLDASYTQELTDRMSSYYQTSIDLSTSENAFRSQLYSQFQTTVQTLRVLDSNDCLDAIGGIKEMISPILKMAAMATGFTGMAAAGVVTMVLDLASSVTGLLTDRKLHKAKSALDRLDNDQMIACTYYALKYSACEYQYARKISSDKDKVIQLLKGKVDAQSNHPEFQKLVYLKARVDLFQKIFDSVLNQGTALSMDASLLVSYIVAIIAKPNEIKVPGREMPPFDYATPQGQLQAQQWLNDVRLRGISFSTTGVNGQLDAKAQVDSAIIDIDNKRNVISSAEATIRDKQAFNDVRNTLNQIPGLRRIIKDSKELIKDFIDGQYQDRLDGYNKSALFASYELIDQIGKFISIDVTTVPCSDSSYSGRLQCYEKELNEAGNSLFRTMSRGAIASASSQTVLVIPFKAAQKIQDAIDTIEAQFLREDLDSHTLYDNSYASFRDQSRMTSLVLKNYSDYAVQKPFDESKYQTGFSSMEKAFSKEIKRMIERAAQNDRTLFNESDDKNSYDTQDRLGQLCSLFASSLPNINGGAKLLAMCKERVKEMRLLDVITPKPLPVDYGNPCFLPNYERLLTIQSSIVRQIPQLGSSEAIK